MSIKGKLAYWDKPDSGFLRLRGREDSTIVWAGAEDTAEGDAGNHRGRLDVRLGVGNGGAGHTRGRLSVSGFGGDTGRLELKGPVGRLVTMGQKNYRSDEGTPGRESGREGAINIFHSNAISSKELRASLYVVPGGFAILQLRDDEGNITLTLDGGDGTIASAVSPSRLVVQEAGGGHGSYNVDYAVFGLRKDHADFRVVSKDEPRPSARRKTSPAGA
jgi:hypothetical protein